MNMNSEYVGIDEAKQRKLLEVTPEGNFILRADFKETGKRKSFRLSSKKSHRDQIVMYVTPGSLA